MDNQHLFELINAAPGLSGWPLHIARVIADDLIYLIPLAMAWGWLRGKHAARRELLQLLLSVALALAVGQVVSHLWPQPRPFALHLGTQFLAHANDSGMPSDHVTVLWSLAVAAFMTRHFDIWAMPLLAIGLVVGWSRVFLGVHFPYDVLGSMPVALLGAFVARLLWQPLLPAVGRLLYLYDRLEKRARALWPPIRKA